MYRSSSSSIVSGEYFSPVTSPTSANHHHVAVDQLLPTYNSPQQGLRKDQKSRIRSAENAIHLIPILLLLSVLVLWFFSTPVNLVTKGDHSLVERVTSSIASGGDNSDINKGVANGNSLLSEDNVKSFELNERSEGNDPAN